MDDMKISFKVEITGCNIKGVKCPHLDVTPMGGLCALSKTNHRYMTYSENVHKLTKTCPMVRAQFEQ